MFREWLADELFMIFHALVAAADALTLLIFHDEFDKLDQFLYNKCVTLSGIGHNEENDDD